MTKKINESYGNLNPEQKSILREYAVYGIDEADSEFEKFLADIKTKSLKSLEKLKENTDNDILLSKIDKVVEKINNLSESKINDAEIAKYLKVSELKSQLGG
jgi:hypothetical protein